MTESVSWSLNVSSTTGAGLNDAASLELPATLFATVEVEAKKTTDYTFQIGQLDKVGVLAVRCSIYGGKVSLKGSGGSDKAICLDGPILLVGDAVDQIATSLTTIKIKNDHDTQTATLDILIGLKLV